MPRLFATVDMPMLSRELAVPTFGNLMMVREGLRFVVVSGQFPKVAVDVIRIAALDFQLNGHVFDSKVYGNPVLDQLQQLQPYVRVWRR